MPPDAKRLLQEIYLAPTRVAAEEAFTDFGKTYADKYPKAAACLEKDHAQLLQLL